jgi:transposase
MTGTTSQIEFAEPIKSSANDEFDRVAKAFHAIARKQAGQDRIDTLAIIQILEEKRKEVTAIDQAGYFIRTWRELNDQVRRMIGQDERYRAIKANRKTDRDTTGGEFSKGPDRTA